MTSGGRGTVGGKAQAQVQVELLGRLRPEAGRSRGDVRAGAGPLSLAGNR